MSSIDAALDFLKSLKPGETPNFTQVAKKYGCDRNTLSRRYRGVQGSIPQKLENQQLLNKTQEKELVEYIDSLCSRGLPPTRQMIRNFGSEIAGKPAGKS
jgi:AraC-like DNA-binding protein